MVSPTACEDRRAVAVSASHRINPNKLQARRGVLGRERSLLSGLIYQQNRRLDACAPQAGKSEVFLSGASRTHDEGWFQP